MLDEWLFIALGVLIVALVFRIEFLMGRVDTVSEYLRRALLEIDKLKKDRS